MTTNLAKTILAQLHNTNIERIIREKHSDKFDILIKNLNYINSNNIDNKDLDIFLNKIKKNSDSTTHTTLYLDKIITNANLLDTEINPKQITIETPKTEEKKVEKENLKYIKPSSQNLNDIASKSEMKESLNVNTIAKVVATTITQLKDSSGEMIGIFGKWGRGKTYLVEKIQSQLEKEENFIEYKWINFSAWKYNNSQQTWVYLYETIANEYWENIDKNENKIESTFQWCFSAKNATFYTIQKDYLINKISKGWKIVPKFDIFLFLFSIIGIIFSLYFKIFTEFISFFGVIITIKFIYIIFLTHRFSSKHILDKYVNKSLSKDILGLQAEIEKEIIIILKAWVDDGSKTKIVLFVDDLDRANLDDMLKILDSLRVILNNENIYKRLIIITAIDEELLELSFNEKYTKSELFYDYLQKIFIFGIKLDEINSDEVIEFTQNLIKFQPKNETTNDDNTVKNSYEELNSSNNKEEKSPSPKKNEIKLSNEEKEEILKKIKELKKPTPRKIRIFYYKFIILKSLLSASNKEKSVSEILDDLIKIENDKSNISEDNIARIVLLP